MIVHFGMERFMFDTNGTAMSVAPDEEIRPHDYEEDLVWLVVTLPGGDDVPVFCSTSQNIDSIMANIAMAALHQSPYVMFDTAEEEVQMAPGIVEEVE